MKTLITILMLTGVTAFCCGNYEMLGLASYQRTVMDHLRAIKDGDKKVLESLWDKDKAQIIEIKNGIPAKLDPEKTFEMWTRTKNPDLNAKILSSSQLTDDIAVVKVSLNWKGSSYVELLTLIKVNLEWKIIGKAYKAPDNSNTLYGVSP